MLNDLPWLIASPGMFLGTWLLYDGIRAFIVGDFTTPKKGAYAGQLGLWSHVILALGLDPQSPLVKAVHVTLGLMWVTSAISLLLGTAWAWWGLLICAITSLWYLPVGTVVAVVQILLLVVFMRSGNGAA